MKNKKAEQLGMNPSTARNRLVKDLLFKFVIEANHKCFQCGGELTKDTISIEHMIPWLDSETPLELFFDLDNIAFSHISCNSKAARSGRKPMYETEEEKDLANKKSKKRYRDKVDSNTGLSNRQLQYLRTGK